MQRRTFLQILGSWLLLGPGLAGGSRAFEAASFSLDDFFQLSSRLTAFPVDSLDRGAGKRFYRRLSASRRELGSELLRAPVGQSNRNGAAVQEFTTALVTFWYTELGLESLAWKSIDFAAPPMTCHNEWWKSPS